MLHQRATIFKMLTSVLVLSPSASAQSVWPFPPEGEHLLWKYSYSGGMLLNAYNQYEYDGEEVELDGQVYKVIRRSHRYEVHNGPGTYYIDEDYHAPYVELRTDADGVTYIHSTEFPPEEVLFDPSIGIGDTVPATWRLIRRDWYGSTVTVTAIDTMLDEQGVARRVWHFNTPDNPWPLTFIEGVGSTEEFLGIPFSLGGPHSELICATYDGAAVIGAVCASLDTGIGAAPPMENGPLRVIPRPGTASYGLNRPCSGTIDDALGRQVLRFGTSSEFDLGTARPGMYILRSDPGESVRFFHEDLDR